MISQFEEGQTGIYGSFPDIQTPGARIGTCLGSFGPPGPSPMECALLPPNPPALFLSALNQTPAHLRGLQGSLCEHMLRFPAGLGTRSGQNTKGEGRGLTEALAVSDRAAASPGFLLGASGSELQWALCVCLCVSVRA